MDCSNVILVSIEDQNVKLLFGNWEVQDLQDLTQVFVRDETRLLPIYFEHVFNGKIVLFDIRRNFTE